MGRCRTTAKHTGGIKFPFTNVTVSENRPSSHLVVIREAPVLKNYQLLVLGRFYLVELDLVIYWNKILFTFEVVPCLILSLFRRFFKGVHQF